MLFLNGLVAAGSLLTAVPDVGASEAGIESSRGSRIYLNGVLATGAPLAATRDRVGRISGAAAACVNCHQRSGLGSYEGTVLIPPIIGPYLFRERNAIVEDLEMPHVPGFVPNIAAYDDQSLAVAIRTGIAPGGRELGALMPRFELDEASMADLIDFLRHLSVGPMPGVSSENLEFATIVTPDADPGDRAATLEVLEKYFKWRNADVGARVQRTRATGVEYRASRYWRLQVWEPTGDSGTWERQLREKQLSHPVFAVISGLSGKNWAPVHAFCEHEHVPCLLPNVVLPVVAEQQFYSIYYSRGVLLEADMIRSSLTAGIRSRGARLIQVYRADDVGAQAAAALATSLGDEHVIVENRVLRARRTSSLPDREGPAKVSGQLELRRSLAGLRREDTVVLWLRSEDIALLGHRVTPADVVMSGLMGGLEMSPLPAEWRSKTRMTYPFDPPDLRRIRMNVPHAWLRSQGILLAHDLVQSDTYLTCVIVADAVDSMLDSFVPEFLVERVETMLGSHQVNGFFPRLSLGSRQRFASKGGYFVNFDREDPNRVVPVGQWLVPQGVANTEPESITPH